jgi:hypothetical protein
MWFWQVIVSGVYEALKQEVWMLKAPVTCILVALRVEAYVKHTKSKQACLLKYLIVSDFIISKIIIWPLDIIMLNIVHGTFIFTFYCFPCIWCEFWIADLSDSFLTHVQEFFMLSLLSTSTYIMIDIHYFIA